ncbi:MAG: hypothetical protein ABIE84_01025 [bacterium]
MSEIRRISPKDLKKIGHPGIEEPIPVGISPVLRSSWKFAQQWARRFNQEMLQDRVKDMLKKLVKRF